MVSKVCVLLYEGTGNIGSQNEVAPLLLHVPKGFVTIGLVV